MTPYAQLAKRLPSWLYKGLAQLYISKDFPRHIFIETTATCNLSCHYCPREKIRKDMDYELFRKIVNEASRYGPRSFSLHLFGEPLLYPRIFEAVRYIKGRNKRNVVLLTTNGTKINECIDDFVSCGIDQAYWTWREEARFNGNTLLKLRSWGKFRVRFIDEITPPEAYEEWKSWKNVEGRKLHNYGGNRNFVNGIAPVAETITTRSRWPCYHLWLAPAVAWNGKFLMCCVDPHQKEVFGDITEETVSQAWKRIDTVRESHLRGEYSGICENCDVWKTYPDLWFGFQKKSS